MSTANNYKYFLYSKTQHNMRVDVDKKINKVFTPGKVFVRGKWVFFTEISNSPSNSYPDTKVVIEGNLSDIKYQNPTSIWGAQ